MAQVIQQAWTLQAEVSAQPRVVVRHQKRRLLSDVLWLIGGKQALVGLTSAMVVGVWIGLGPPDFVVDQLQSYFETGKTLGSDSLWAVDSFGGFTVTTTEGSTMADAQKHPVEIRLWMRIFFFLSLAVNLLIVGALVGVLVTKPKTRYRSPHASRNLVQPYIKALDPENRQAFQTEMVQSY